MSVSFYIHGTKLMAGFENGVFLKDNVNIIWLLDVL